MEANTLIGTTVIVTGAGRGMGKSMSLALARAGANIAMLDIDEEVLVEAEIEIKNASGEGMVKSLICDVANPQDANSAVKETISTFGSVDVLVNNAVVGPERIPGYFVNKTKFWKLNDDLWNSMLRVNIFGTHLMAKTCVPHMISRGWGRIINITTSFDTMYLPGAGAYGPTKAAIEAHTRVMAQDLDGTGVTANILIPGGPVNTRMIPKASGIPRKNLIQPEIMQKPVTWLASQESDGITSMRFIAALWDHTLSSSEKIEKAGFPAAWTQIPSVAIYPPD